MWHYFPQSSTMFSFRIHHTPRCEIKDPCNINNIIKKINIIHRPEEALNIQSEFIFDKIIATCIERTTALRANKTRVKREYKSVPCYSELNKCLAPPLRVKLL